MKKLNACCKLFFYFSLIFINPVFAAGPDCSDINRWPTQSTANRLSDFGIPAANIQFDKTKTTLIVSEAMSESQRSAWLIRENERSRQLGFASNKNSFDDRSFPQVIYKQIYRVTFTDKADRHVEFIITTLASDEECSVGVESVALISKEIIWPN